MPLSADSTTIGLPDMAHDEVHATNAPSSTGMDDKKAAKNEFKPTFYNPFETKHRRRTSRAQARILEASFEENPKPSAAKRQSLAEELSMKPRNVQIWFQNRRAKAKQQPGTIKRPKDTETASKKRTSTQPPPMLQPLYTEWVLTPLVTNDGTSKSDHVTRSDGTTSDGKPPVIRHHPSPPPSSSSSSSSSSGSSTDDADTTERLQQRLLMTPLTPIDPPSPAAINFEEHPSCLPSADNGYMPYKLHAYQDTSSWVAPTESLLDNTSNNPSYDFCDVADWIQTVPVVQAQPHQHQQQQHPMRSWSSSSHPLKRRLQRIRRHSDESYLLWLSNQGQQQQQQQHQVVPAWASQHSEDFEVNTIADHFSIPCTHYIWFISFTLRLKITMTRPFHAINDQGVASTAENKDTFVPLAPHCATAYSGMFPPFDAYSTTTMTSTTNEMIW